MFYYLKINSEAKQTRKPEIWRHKKKHKDKKAANHSLIFYAHLTLNQCSQLIELPYGT
jgi:hypothetical protein